VGPFHSATASYHALTIGTLMDELVRRITGVPIAQFFRDEVAAPRGIDFHIATAEEEEPRVRPVLPALLPAGQQSGLAARGPGPDSLAGLAFNAAKAQRGGELLPNRRIVRAAGQAAASGAGSARGLARLYAMCIAEVDGFPRLLSPDTVKAMTQIQAAGPDLVLGFSTRFAIVFQKADDRFWMGSHQAFGHDGAGGAIGVADPWHGLAYAWIPRRMTFPGGADQRGLALAEIARACITAYTAES
jgi:CubicO group peptidase (beta-lactamase class C family)